MRNLLMAISMGFVMFSLSGCMTMAWEKPGGTTEEFSKVKYQCLQEAQQRVSHAERSGFEAVADSKVKTNNLLFQSCMNAKGWFLVRKNNSNNPPPPPAPVENRRDFEPQAQPAIKEVPTATEVKEEVAKKTPQEAPVVKKNYFAAKTKANLRKEPSTKSEKAGSLEKGDEVEVLSKQGEWYQIITPDGVVAWCNISLLVPKK